MSEPTATSFVNFTAWISPSCCISSKGILGSVSSGSVSSVCFSDSLSSSFSVFLLVSFSVFLLVSFSVFLEVSLPSSSSSYSVSLGAVSPQETIAVINANSMHKQRIAQSKRFILFFIIVYPFYIYLILLYPIIIQHVISVNSV